MSCYMSLIALLNDIDTDENVLTFAMEHDLIYDKQSDKQSCPTCEEHIDLYSRMAVDGAVWRCHKGGLQKIYYFETRIIPGRKQDATENIYFIFVFLI